MKKIYLLFFILCLSINVKAQSVVSTTIVCFRDVNNNGNKDVGENNITSKIGLYLVDSSSNNILVNYCGAPSVFTVSTTQPKYYLFLNYEFNQFSSFWKKFKTAPFDPWKRMFAGSFNFGSTVNVPIPPGFGDQYLPIGSDLGNPVNSNTVPCLPDSVHFTIKLGAEPYDPECSTINNYTFTCNGGEELDLFVNSVLVDTYTITTWCNLTSQMGNMSQMSFMGINLYVALSSNSFTFGVNSIKYVVKNVNGFSVNSVAEYTFNSLVNISCGQLSGYSFVDCNNNCVKDGAEVYGNLNSAFNFLIANNTNTYTMGMNSNGYFNTLIPSGTYSILNSYCPISTSVITIPTSSILTFAQPNTTSTANYASQMGVPTHNWPGLVVTPGGTFQLQAHTMTTNTYCVANPPASVKVKLVLPPDMFYINIAQTTPVPSSIISVPTGDSIIWDIFSSNLPFHPFIAVGAKTTAVMGNTYTLKSIITPLNDHYPLDNISSPNFVYGAPYDPNNKISNHPNMLNNGDITVPVNSNEMLYTINFQNLGNAPAVNVAIRDTFDANLDLSTLKVLNSSFPAVFQVNNGSKEVLFTFQNIMLPPGSANDFTNRGYVTYQVNMNQSLPIGTKIKNRAHIYFDYNSPITTNQTINTLVDPAGIHKQFKGSDLYIYPNPTNGDLFIKTNELKLAKYEIYDLIGKKVSSNNLYSNTIRTNDLTEGVYFLDLYSEDGQKVTFKFVKVGD